MAINVEVTRQGTENGISLIRKFSRRVKGAGILPRLRKIVYHTRDESNFRAKQRKLKGLARKKEIEKLRKLGKLPEGR